MRHLAPPTLTAVERMAIRPLTTLKARDHAIVSMALGTGLRLAELVRVDVGDRFAPDGTPRARAPGGESTW